MDYLQELPVDDELWNRFFTVAPLVVVGTREADGSPDFAPKHLAMPMSWGPYYGFVCSPKHRTYHNAVREQAFTVTFPPPDQLLLAALTASPHCSDGPKPEVAALPCFSARKVEGFHLQGGTLYLECRLDRVIEDLGLNLLIIGRVVAALVDPECHRDLDFDDQEMLRRKPMLVYLYPGRWAAVRESYSFPFPSNFKR